MLREWQNRYPGRVENIVRSLHNVAPSHLLDRGLFDFAALAVSASERSQRKSCAASTSKA
jgi:tRNA 2-thiocytidine biosynthesis protein TtcA